MAPRSPEAKANVSRNALKHGLTAKTHMVLDCEDVEAYQTFRADVRRRLEPDGPM